MQTTISDTASQSGAQRPLDIHHDSADEWVAALPLANLGETCRLIYGSLTQMNGVEAPPAQRVKTLETLREPVRYLRDAMRRHYTGTAFPLPEKARKVAGLLREIKHEMAKGYRRAAYDILGQSGLRQDLESLVTALHRALYYHGQSLLSSYELYQEIHGARWRDIYSLYLEAERKALHLTTVKDPFKQGEANTSVSDMFKQILLLALADPHRLTQQEMRTVYTMLDGWAAQCQLYGITDFNEPPGVFVVDLSGDAPPAHLVYNNVQQQAATRLLDTTALAHSLRGLLTQANQGAAPSTRAGASNEAALSRDLLRRLLISWGYTSKRAFSRSQQPDSMSVTFGLSACHRAVSEPGAGAAPAASVRCRIINESATGARLRWEGDETARARVGELIVLRHGEEETAHQSIAVIRWMKSFADHSVDFGIQMLVPEATPVSVRLADAKQAERDYLKALLLPPLPPTELLETLITPAHLYRPGDIISVHGGQDEQRYRLVRAIEGTQSFTRFEFATLAAALSEEDEEQVKQPVRNKDFDSVWSGL